MKCSVPGCDKPVERRLTWRELIVAGWMVQTERDLCRFDAVWIARRLKDRGVAYHVERVADLTTPKEHRYANYQPVV